MADFDQRSMSLGMAMAQSDIQAMQNNMERGLASNPSMSLNDVAEGMSAFNSLSSAGQRGHYGRQANMDLSRDLSTRSLLDNWEARQTAKAVGVKDMSPYNEGLGAKVAGGIIDFATGKMPMGIGAAFNSLTGRSPGEMGVDMGYADLSRQNASGVDDPQSSYASASGLGMDAGNKSGVEGKLLSLIEKMSSPSAVVREV
jgi:hypothetical protein